MLIQKRGRLSFCHCLSADAGCGLKVGTRALAALVFLQHQRPWSPPRLKVLSLREEIIIYPMSKWKNWDLASLGGVCQAPQWVPGVQTPSSCREVSKPSSVWSILTFRKSLCWGSKPHNVYVDFQFIDRKTEAQKIRTYLGLNLDFCGRAGAPTQTSGLQIQGSPPCTQSYHMGLCDPLCSDFSPPRR